MKPKRRHLRGLYAPELLEARIAPATFIVTNLNDAGAGSLRHAVHDANLTDAADTVLFKAGLTGKITLATGRINISTDLSIVGPGAGKLTIDANHASRIFSIDDGSGATVKTASISGLKLINGAVDGHGGAIYSRESLDLTSVVVSHNTTVGAPGMYQSIQGSGGGVYVSSTGSGVVNVTVTNSRFTGNSAIHGGGLFAAVNGSIKIIGTIISGNHADRDGGGLFASISTPGIGNILLKNCAISGNTASGNDGGGASLQNHRVGGKTTVRGTTLAHNVGANSGGGLSLEGGIVVIENATISHNSARSNGGGIAEVGVTSLRVLGSNIIGNSSDDGGGISIFGQHPVLIQDSVIAANSSGRNGGGIEASRGGAITVRNTILSGNTAAELGGGISIGTYGSDEGNSLKLIGVTLAGNRASDKGGGVSISGESRLDVIDSLFLSNHAISGGGGIRFDGDDALNISGSTFMGNVSVKGASGYPYQFIGAGGGLEQSGSGKVLITDSVFVRNVSESDGGAIALSGEGHKSIVRTLIKGNQSQGNGGGVFSGQSPLTLKQSTITGNVATTGGGVFNYVSNPFYTFAPTVLIESTVKGNFAPTDPEKSGDFKIKTRVPVKSTLD